MESILVKFRINLTKLSKRFKKNWSLLALGFSDIFKFLKIDQILA